MHIRTKVVCLCLYLKICKLLRGACPPEIWNSVLKVLKQAMKNKANSSPTLTSSSPHTPKLLPNSGRTDWEKKNEKIISGLCHSHLLGIHMVEMHAVNMENIPESIHFMICP